MAAFVVKDFGGEIPRRGARLLPDNMATLAANTDLSSGPLDGLKQPVPVITLTAPWPVRKAYRVPGPNPGDGDVWMPLPSEYSSVVPSPMANDTHHRIYWTNPPGQPDAGAWWNTYARLAAGAGAPTGPNGHYSIGFIPADPTAKPVVTVTGGTHPSLYPTSLDIDRLNAGWDYVPDMVTRATVIGGTLVPGGHALQFVIARTWVKWTTWHIVASGSGGTDSEDALFAGTTGTGERFQFRGTVALGQLVSINQIVSQGSYATNPTDVNNEPVTSANLVSGAVIGFRMEPSILTIVDNGTYAIDGAPISPAPTFGVPGSGLLVNMSFAQTSTPPLLERSYVYTLVDAFGSESSPSAPSDVVAGPIDGTWTITNLPATAPATPPGKTYPPPVITRLYRTLTGETSGAQFYFVVDLPFGTISFVDTIPDTTVVNNNTLASASWAPPVDGLDGLLAMPGGMLVAFTDDTVHFCEPNRPHTWPAGYDQSLLYPIVALALWQQSLIVLTKGFPSTGTGNSPSQFSFAQIQTPEPCIARGSVVTDLAGVYYASANGLVTLNYFGAQNQTLSNLTREIWLTKYQAQHIVACRHRAQYLAINGTGSGFIVDYSEQRMGLCSVSPFVSVVSVWNDVYTGDTYMMAPNTVYLWDSPTAPPLVYNWRSREFYMAAPVSLGACQISLDPSVSAVELEARETEIPMPQSSMPDLVLPPGINALFRLFVGPSQELVHEQYLQQPRCIFRLPSGRKAFNWQFELVSRVPVHSVELASTMRELKGV